MAACSRIHSASTMLAGFGVTERCHVQGLLLPPMATERGWTREAFAVVYGAVSRLTEVERRIWALGLAGAVEG